MELAKNVELFQHHNYVCKVLINSKKKNVMLCNLFVANSKVLSCRKGVMTDAQVLRKASLLPVQLQLRIESIKFAARLFGKALEELRRLAADENGNDPDTWHGLWRQDLEQMALIMHTELGAMPPYSCQPEEWHKLWADFPGAWKLLVKRFARRLQESYCSSQDGGIADTGQLAHVPSDLDGVRARTAASNSHQIVDWPYVWPETCSILRGKGWHLLIVQNVASIPGCDLCTTCLTRVRSVWNGAYCLGSL